MEINSKNKLEISILYMDKIYKLESQESIYNAQKWFNSIKLVKDMGDIVNLDPLRYAKIKCAHSSKLENCFQRPGYNT